MSGSHVTRKEFDDFKKEYKKENKRLEKELKTIKQTLAKIQVRDLWSAYAQFFCKKFGPLVQDTTIQRERSQGQLVPVQADLTNMKFIRHLIDKLRDLIKEDDETVLAAIEEYSEIEGADPTMAEYCRNLKEDVSAFIQAATYLAKAGERTHRKKMVARDIICNLTPTSKQHVGKILTKVSASNTYNTIAANTIQR